MGAFMVRYFVGMLAVWLGAVLIVFIGESVRNAQWQAQAAVTSYESSWIMIAVGAWTLVGTLLIVWSLNRDAR